MRGVNKSDEMDWSLLFERLSGTEWGMMKGGRYVLLNEDSFVRNEKREEGSEVRELE